MEELSPQEVEVLELVQQGGSNAEIAERLCLAVPTVESHVAALVRKLEVPDQQALTNMQQPDSKKEMDVETVGTQQRELPTGVVTFVFTDVEGSSQLWEDHPEEMTQALADHDRLIADAVEVGQGWLLKSRGEGDSSVSVFVKATDAVRTATTLQQVLATHTWPAECVLRVRVAVHTGEANLRDGDYFGPTLNRAARVRELAAGGQVLCSRTTADVVAERLPDGCTLVEVGVTALRGMRRAEQVFEIRPDGAADDAAESEGPMALPPALVTAAAAPFVGRIAETEKLAAALSAKQGLEVVLIAGEPGIGKTTLAARTAAKARDHGASVLLGHCQQGAAIPFQPVVEALGSWVDAQPSAPLRRIMTPEALDVSLLLPHLRRRMPESPAPTGAEHERYRMFAAVPEFLRLIADGGPVVIVLEDLHWADSPTIQLLRHLVAEVTDVPLVLIGTYRDTDVAASHPLSDALIEWRRAGVSDVIELAGLSESDITAFVAPDSLPDPADRALAATLWNGTEGNPLFLRELLRHLEETGAVERRPQRRWLARRHVEAHGIPKGVKDTVAQRIARLDEATVTVLTAGSVMGREIRVSLTEAVTGLDPNDVLNALEVAEQTGLVVEVPGMLGRFRFTHALVQAALYEQLSHTRRAHLHQQIAEAIEGLGATDADLVELAYHYTLAVGIVGPDRAVEYCQRAGQQARLSGAWEDAAAHFQTALGLFGDSTQPSVARADLLTALGDVQWVFAGVHVARSTYSQAAQVARALGDGERLARIALGFSGLVVQTTLADQGTTNEAVTALLEEALELLRDKDTTLRARVSACLATELFLNPETMNRRHRLVDEALAVANRLNDPETLAFVHTARIFLHYSGDALDLDQCIAEGTAALESAQSCGDRATECVAAWLRGISFGSAGQFSQAWSDWEAHAVLAKELKHPYHLTVASMLAASRKMSDGDLEAAVEIAAEGFQFVRSGDTLTFAAAFASIAGARFLQGRLAEMAGAFPALIDEIPRMAGFVHTWAALAALQSEDQAEARDQLSRVNPSDFATFPTGVYWPFFAGSASLAAAEMGDLALASQLIPLLSPYRGTFATIGGAASFMPISLPLAVLAAAVGDARPADQQFEEAIAMSRRNELPVMLALSQIHYAKALAARGAPAERERARVLREEAVESAKGMGVGEVLRVAAQVDAILSGRSPAPPSPERSSRPRRARSAAVVRARSVLQRLTASTADRDLARRMRRPLAQWTVFSAMARTFDADESFEFEGDLVFELVSPDADTAPVWWTLEIRGDKAVARRGDSSNPTVTVRVRTDDLIRITSGQLHPLKPFIAGRLTLSGDVLVGLRLPEMFGSLG
jgi:class 3 adenylate cyclase